ncbi:uncharacterized protein LOC141904555 [Tubulanus polymorphus]|uniref:uncharacterized protein LOC141904555 n=1 Tax=Tubulanus polymorphus TaxID=672921 RepID=UPI003DA2476F
MMAYLSSFGTFWIFGGALYYHYYVRNRDQAENWKCQPDRFLTPENTRHAFTLGSVNMLIGSTVSGLVSSYVSNNGPSKIYYSISDMGWPYFLMSIPIFFLACDGMSYYFHRLFHWPPFYKRIHKVHHRYHQPIIWTATAMHPIELLTLQAALLLPVFVIPIHAGIFIGNLVYSYYYGMIDHSGITMDAIWPWQPSSKFHDDHHKYFHCNIGFNSKLFDWLHGTLVRENRKYGEDVFGCKGAPLEAANHNKSGKPKKIN